MELDALRQALVKAAEQNATLRKEVLQDSAGDLVALASAMAERVIRRELKADPSIVATWAQEGIATLLDKDSVTVAVSSDIAQILPVDVLSEALGPDVHVLEDAHLAPYSCEVRAKHARVDVGLRGQLDAVFGALEEREKEP